MSRRSRAVAAPLAAGLVGVIAMIGALLVSPHAGSAATLSRRQTLPRSIMLAPGVLVSYDDVTITPGYPVRTELLRLDLSRRVRLGAAIPSNVIGGGRQTIAELVRRHHGIAGVNADFFDAASTNGEPKGGVVVNGVIVKTPLRYWDANFYLRDGRARIGRVDFVGSVTRAARPASPRGAAAPPTHKTLSGVNEMGGLSFDRLQLVTSGLARPRFGQACAAVLAATSARGITVTAVNPSVNGIAPVTRGGFALVACGTGSRATWLRTELAVGDRLTVTASFDGGTPSAVVSGGRVLVSDGRAASGSGGRNIRGRNPETFGCVARDGLRVVLGTVDGRWEGSSGMSLAELTRYLLRLRCWSGIVFDGGGSSTMVGQRPGTSRVSVLNRPSDRAGARAVSSGLVVYRQ